MAAPLRSEDGLSIYNTEFPPPVFVVDKLLPRGLTLTAGRPKVGKSWLTLQLAVDLALGQSALGHFRVPAPGHVTYLALEEPQSRTHHRLLQIVPKPDPRLENIRFLYEIRPLMDGGADQLDEFLKANPSELVIIDTLLALVAAHSSRRDILRGDYTEVNTLRQLADKHNTTMLCVAHSRKAPGDLVDSIIGTSGTTAACDSIWQLKRISSDQAVLEVKGRELEEAQYGLRLNTGVPFGWQVTGSGAAARITTERREILEVLERHGAKKPGEIAKMLGKNASTVRRLIQNLVLDGLIEKQADGTYVPVSG